MAKMMFLSKKNKNAEFVLIPLAVFFQFFACCGTYFLKSCSTGAINPSSISLTVLAHTFLIYWVAFSFVGRIFGAYFFGKYADKVNFFKVSQLVGTLHILVSLFIVTVCIAGEHSYLNYNGTYAACFFYSSLMPVTLILPAIYLLSRSPESQHIFISTTLILATFLGKFFAYTLVHYTPAPRLQIWYWLPVFSGVLALGIYRYVEKHIPSAVHRTETIKYSASSIYTKLLALAIGAAGNAGITYYYSFLNPYLTDIAIIQNFVLIKNQPPFYIAIGLFLLPAAKICQKFGALNTMSFSLTSMIVIGVLIPFFAISDFVYTIFQILFACVLANLMAPSLAIVYQLFKSTKSKFEIIFWFSLGTSLSMLFLGAGSRIGFSLHFPLAGMFIFAIIISVCLAGILTKSFSRKVKSLSDNGHLNHEISPYAQKSKAVRY